MSLNIGTGLASALHDIKYQKNVCEDVIIGAINDFSEKFDAYIKRIDYYDNSIEFWANPNAQLSELDQEVLWILGFDCCWVCHHKDENKIRISEWYYWKDDLTRKGHFKELD